MTLIQIKDGQGRPVNPINLITDIPVCFDPDQERIEMWKQQQKYDKFEQSVTYHPAPGCSESDGVEGELQHYWLMPCTVNDWYLCELEPTNKRYKDLTIKSIWVLSQKAEVKEVDNSPWINVKDKLPEESGLVLICLENTQDIYISFYKKQQKLFQVWGAGRDPICDMKTTHWMEMPKPPMYKCREMDCDNDATKEEYPGNAFYLCDEHYEKYHPSPPTH